MKWKIFKSPINPNAMLDDDDFIIDINEQIKYLKKNHLQISSHENIVNLLHNYGFNKLFRAYSKPFVIINDLGQAIFKDGVSENDVHLLYQFDNKLKGLINLLLNSFESKLNANINQEINLIYPDISTQLENIWPKSKEQQRFIKQINAKFNEGSHYLKPFIDKNIYPAWIILDTLTLGEKCYLAAKIYAKNHNKFENILKNFKVEKFLNFDEFKTIIFDVIRPFRNLIAHGERLMCFEIHLDNNDKKIFMKFLKIFNQTHTKYNLEYFDNKINSFHLMILLVYFLDDWLVTNPTQHLISQIEQIVDEIKMAINEFSQNDFEILTDQKFYNWPQDWKIILKNIQRATS